MLLPRDLRGHRMTLREYMKVTNKADDRKYPIKTSQASFEFFQRPSEFFQLLTMVCSRCLTEQVIQHCFVLDSGFQYLVPSQYSVKQAASLSRIVLTVIRGQLFVLCTVLKAGWEPVLRTHLINKDLQ